MCEHFNKNDVNGEIRISVPEDATAQISIVYESPEYDKHEYYNSNLAGGELYSFQIEGRDKTADDYRDYMVSVSLTGGKYNLTSEVYSDIFNIPDGNDNPDSYTIIKYDFTIDDKENKNIPYTVTKDTPNEKQIVFYLNNVMLGDVNGDSFVDSSDASAILAEYAVNSTGGKPTFSSMQFVAADVNKDGYINSSDASKILSYYSETSTGGKPTWD